MFFRIEPDSGTSIFEQIVDQVIFRVASGSLPAGGRIPSVRDLAQRITVHPNTVAKAYQELERKGIVVTRRGLGMDITAEAPELCRRLREERVRKRLRAALQEAIGSSLPPEEVRRMVEEELSGLNGEPIARLPTSAE